MPSDDNQMFLKVHTKYKNKYGNSVAIKKCYINTRNLNLKSYAIEDVVGAIYDL